MILIKVSKKRKKYCQNELTFDILRFQGSCVMRNDKTYPMLFTYIVT